MNIWSRIHITRDTGSRIPSIIGAFDDILSSYATGFTLSETADSISVSVEDDGIGISGEDLPKIWERFYQADPSRTANGSGSMGLGLSMVSSIAKCHNGNITVKSELGKGSVFTFTMPKKQSQALRF